jgi:hypothetical protein
MRLAACPQFALENVSHPTQQQHFSAVFALLTNILAAKYKENS